LSWERGIIPGSAVKQSPRGGFATPNTRLVEGAPLLEEEGNFCILTLFADASRPIGLHAACSMSAFASDYDPLDVSQAER